MSEPSIPEGFTPLPIGGEFIKTNGPLYFRREAERVQLGFRVEARHTNPMGICHGGMLASFADMLLPVCIHRHMHDSPKRFLPTISLQLDYMAPAPLGAWVQGEAQVLRSTLTMVFAQGLISADGKLAVRVSGTFKLGKLLSEILPKA